MSEGDVVTVVLEMLCGNSGEERSTAPAARSWTPDLWWRGGHAGDTAV
jgi:hypothetical protein